MSRVRIPSAPFDVSAGKRRASKRRHAVGKNEDAQAKRIVALGYFARSSTWPRCALFHSQALQGHLYCKMRRPTAECRLLLRLRRTIMVFSSSSPQWRLACRCAVAFALANLMDCGTAADADPINTVFVIAMENHNWTQPISDTSAPQQIFNNANAPFINSVVNSNFNGGALNPQVTLYGTSSAISINSQVSYAT